MHASPQTCIPAAQFNPDPVDVDTLDEEEVLVPPPLPVSSSSCCVEKDAQLKPSSQVAPAAQPKENAAESAMSDVRILLASMVLYYHVGVDVCTILEEFFTARRRSCEDSDPTRW